MIKHDSGTVTPPGTRRPDFMIVGAMKSGTTALYQYLGRHPRVFMCSPKEPRFFSVQEVYTRGLDWYFSLFREAGEDQICGEASACYSRWPHFGDVAARIREAVPDAKFIYIMRHPVERAYSHYRHEMEERQLFASGKVISFEQALEEIPEILETSLYRLQLEKFLDYFPRDRFLLLFFEDLTTNPGPLLEEVQRFLSLELANCLLESEVMTNAFGSRSARVSMRTLRNSIRQAPGVSTIVNLIPRSVRSWIRARLKFPSPTLSFVVRRRVQALERQLTPLDDTMRKRLLERFADANRELEKLMGRHVPPSWHE